MARSPLLHVLVVDDENSFRLTLEMGLKMTNEFVVQSCDSGESALEALKKDAFDVILLDNRMPDMTGLDVMEWMHGQAISTPVIMVTAAGSEAVAVEAMKLGVYDYIRKDQLDIERLRIAVKSVYERYMYRKQIIERDAEDRFLKEKQEEVDGLRTFHQTVNSVGQLAEKSLSDLAANLGRYEDELLLSAKDEGRAKVRAIVAELKGRIDVISSGVSSMRNMSAIVTKKLDDIHIAPGQTTAKK